jgi:uncharacterized protein YdaU (DUF1376 family)
MTVRQLSAVWSLQGIKLMPAPYMPFYIADYHGDTFHLNRSEHGAYLLLLMAMWRAGGKLPRCDNKLAKLAKCTPDEWAEIKTTMLDFFEINGGQMTHKRITKELSKYETRVNNSRKGGLTTASQKRNEINEKNDILLPSKSQVTRTITRTNNKPPIIPLDGDDCFNDFWSDYPRKVSKAQALKQWSKMNKADRDAAITGLKEQAAVWIKDKTEERFIPHAATWLNGRRFEDFNQAPDKPKEMTVEERQNHEKLCQIWRDRLAEYKETRRWLLYWGRLPNHWECTIPNEVLIEFGYEPRKISA